ncbi:hypothetical protein QFZ71_004886 [Streptomyces sp. V2I9]|nr:hypothetical protein [Streptomyces sp. V2I9]
MTCATSSAPVYGVMRSSPEHPARTPRNVSGTDAEGLALYREKFRHRLPESLDELHGPTHGVAELPLYMTWSGMPHTTWASHASIWACTAPSCTRARARTCSSSCGRCYAPSSVAPCAPYGKTLSLSSTPAPGSPVTGMPELHTRLLVDWIALGSPYPLVLTGDYAVRAHRLVYRPSRVLDVAPRPGAHGRHRGRGPRRPGRPEAGRCRRWRPPHWPPASQCATQPPGRSARSTSSRKPSNGQSPGAGTDPSWRRRM